MTFISYFVLWYSTTLFCFSVYSSFDLWNPFGYVLCLFEIIPNITSFILTHTNFLVLRDTPDSFCIFLDLVLQAAISPRKFLLQKCF